MVFKTLAASIINQVLGEYVSNLQTDQLELGIWDGHVKLQNLKLRNDIFTKLNLPIQIVDGIVGEIILNIPWQDLGKLPLKIALKDVFVVAASLQTQYDPEEEEERLQQQKLEKLKRTEIEQQKSSDNSYFGPIMRTIVDNIQLSMKNIHIRYEDDLTSLQNPFSIGITLTELTGVSKDKNWINDPDPEDDTIFKHLKLRDFGIYCSTDSWHSKNAKGLSEKVFTSLIMLDCK